MSDWKQKRFWTDVTVSKIDEGYTILLDGRRIKTPAKTAFYVPSERLAEEIAKEWDAQTDVVNPNTMPFTRAANSAIDKVTPQHSEVADMLADYGGTDLLCYRADSPEELIQRQAEAWDPLLAWSAEALEAPLIQISGVMFASQPKASLESLKRRVHELDSFMLAGFHDLVAISGSLVIGFAALNGHMGIENLWEVSRLDESWQAEQWGEDEEATQQALLKREAFIQAAKYCALL
ncbi:ATP12 family chaperone protein [Cochlodiniinecator piscidefendens]|uniref:ATP12 family chaperone protein n=1 Tax=Cochlodiniinecator piscidefendens TaxID=2715756 RepID=UPI00140B74D4|nr:ATP12 family protein [Cochlodiniinecator piscidefendens]